jgi:hypothetical protein
MLFVHKAIAPLCSIVTSAAVATGVGNTLGNKGGVGIFLKIGNTRILVVNAHFTAHQEAVRQRNNDFHKINKLLPVLLEKRDLVGKTATAEQVVESVENNVPLVVLNNKEEFNNINDKENNQEKKENNSSGGNNNQSQPEDLLPNPVGEPSNNERNAEKETTNNYNNNTEDHDSDLEPDDETSPRVSAIASEAELNIPSLGKDLKSLADIVIFMGDLNYRIRGNRSIINKLLDANMHEVLLMNDQLRTSMQANEVMQGYIGKGETFFEMSL